MAKEIYVPDILPPSEDGVFKSLLTNPDAESVLIDVISSVLQIQVIKATVQNTELHIENFNEKRNRFDVNCQVDDGTQVDVEMQSKAMEGDTALAGHWEIRHRSIYNVCDLHAKQNGRGILYQDLKRSFQVTFCGYKVFPRDSRLVHRYHMREDESNELLANSICSIFVELAKLDSTLKKSTEKMTDLEKWSVFFAYATDPEYSDVVAKITAEKEAIKVATDVLHNISKNEIERANYRSRRMFEMDEASNLIGAKKSNSISIAKKMLDENFPVDLIVRLTELRQEEVEELIAILAEGDIDIEEQDRLLPMHSFVMVPMANLETAIKNERISVAKYLLQTSLPVEQIVQATGLTMEEIEGLRDSD